jgi:hypothetical protein
VLIETCLLEERMKGFEGMNEAIIEKDREVAG